MTKNMFVSLIHLIDGVMPYAKRYSKILLVVPARLVRTGDRNMLKFPVGYPYQDLFHRVTKKIENLKI